jgi:hypothetical protein
VSGQILKINNKTETKLNILKYNIEIILKHRIFNHFNDLLTMVFALRANYCSSTASFCTS